MQQMQHVSMHARNILYKPRQMPFSFAKIRKHVDLKFKLVRNIRMIIISVYMDSNELYNLKGVVSIIYIIGKL